MHFLLLLALTALTATALPAIAQDRAEIAAGAALSTDVFGAPWSPEPGLTLRLSLPVHGGVADAALGVLPFRSDDPLTPDFLLATATAGWGPRLAVGAAALTPTARLGSAVFRFEPDVDNPELNLVVNEFEVAVGASLRGEVSVGRVLLWAEGAALRVALREPVTLPSLGAGVGLRFGVPPLVRRLLDE